jgi:hypothetical protein
MLFGKRFAYDFHSAEGIAFARALALPDYKRLWLTIPCSCDRPDGSHRPLAAIGMKGK